jgi:hypothetical protein
MSSAHATCVLIRLGTRARYQEVCRFANMVGAAALVVTMGYGANPQG